MAGFHGHVRLAEATASGCGNPTGHFQQAVLPWASPRTGLLLDADRGAALFSLNGAFQGGCRLPQRPMWRAAMAGVSTRDLRNDLQLIICSCDSWFPKKIYFQSHNWNILVYIYLHILSNAFKLAFVFSGKTKKTGFRGATKPLNRRHCPEVFLHCLRCIQGLGGTLQKALGRVSRPFGGCD